ncbi:uncharacterized protein LOC142142516 [Mixophyes fleayi]|uniref:uncharacterized protein LOC142142516 n=1 Tax=Mixophyes fleayi TaxID=3061075 RepID=UPI003F4DA5EB
MWGARDSKWLLKSLRNSSSLNWSISDFQRKSQVQPGKESYNSVPLCKSSSTVENHKEGRASPEQEAEEMEDQYDEEPISKFDGSLSETQNSRKEERCQWTFVPENNKTTKLKILLKSNWNQHNLLSASNVPLKNNRLSEPSTHFPAPSQAPLKIPRIILTHPSTSDEDIDQLTQDQDFDLEEPDMTEDHLFLDCLQSTPSNS